ncbi:DEKNAAC104842 [Brettanomyces naardenensis]|uniref:Metacaspase-1 n=1 Tax=Brettanomyces naardenensis TaxID=13370 RepID=A0A448YS04_BRENA|nr:DEKNAAC104842 [Brettanomyces naardenensis]
MFPGSSGANYSRQSSQGQYAPPNGAPPSYGQQYQRPPSAPPSGQPYQRPSNAPPGYQRPSLPEPDYSQGGKLYENPATRATNTVNGITYENPDNSPPLPSQSTQSFQVNGQVQNFAYSQCNGVKKALLIGINYIGTSNALRGCINDANNMYRFLTANGYPPENIVMLTDDQQDMVRQPTRANMIRAMQWLAHSQPGDSLVLAYSGHGGTETDRDGDEADGLDDCIYPVDFQQSGSLIDDVIHDILVRPLPAGCRLTAIFDSCHSGTALDLPFVYRAQDGGLKEYNVWKESGGDAMSIVMGYATRNPMEMFNGAKSIYRRFAASNSANSEAVKQQKMSPADVIMFSGCKDSQTSADAQEQGQFTGALSWAFISVMQQNPVQSYLTLLQNIRAVLATKYTQKPQMSSSHPIDPNLRFIM